MSFRLSNQSDEAWFDLYRRIFFQVKDSNGMLICFTALTAEQDPFFRKKQFAIITAFNPMNERQSELVNQRNNILLEEDLRQGGYEFYKTLGVLNGHQEESFTIENISRSEAVSFGVKYRQHAILYNDNQGVQFLRCCRESNS